MLIDGADLRADALFDCFNNFWVIGAAETLPFTTRDLLTGAGRSLNHSSVGKMTNGVFVRYKQHTFGY